MSCYIFKNVSLQAMTHLPVCPPTDVVSCTVIAPVIGTVQKTPLAYCRPTLPDGLMTTVPRKVSTTIESLLVGNAYVRLKASPVVTLVMTGFVSTPTNVKIGYAA